MSNTANKPERRMYNKFQSERMMGAQNYGNRIIVEQWTQFRDPHDGETWSDWNTIEEHFVPCLVRYEPETKNKIGGKGAYRDIPNQEKVDALVAQLKEKYNV